MAVTNSNGVQTLINGNAIGFAVATSLSMKNDLMSVTKGPTNGFVEKISALKGASITFEGLVTSSLSTVHSLEGNLANGSKITWRFLSPNLSGDGFISGLSVSAGINNSVRYSGTIEVSAKVAKDIITELRTLRVKGDDLTIEGDTLLVAVQI